MPEGVYLGRLIKSMLVKKYNRNKNKKKKRAQFWCNNCDRTQVELRKVCQACGKKNRQ